MSITRASKSIFAHAGIGSVAFLLGVPGAMAATGNVTWTNPPQSVGVIERTDDESDVTEYIYNVNAGHTNPPRTRFEVGDEVTFEPGLGNVATDVSLQRPSDGEAVRVVPSREAVLTFGPELEFSLTILAHSATFEDGSRTGFMAVTELGFERFPSVPEDPPEIGITLQIQPMGVRFDPPAPIQFPNITGLPPGESVQLFSFDHDAGEFVAIGTGTVSEDGFVITSDPGRGILKGG